MYHKTKGIVLHTIKYSETSVIAKIYTEKFGLLSFIVKGVRSAKAKSKASLMQPLTLLQMEVNYREHRNIQFAKEFSREYNYHSLPFDTLKSTMAMFLLEVITKTVREPEPNEDLFEFLYSVLLQLDTAEKLHADFHLLFLLHLSQYLGFAPHRNFSDIAPYFEMREGFFVKEKEHPTYILSRAESKQLFDLMEAHLFGQSTIVVHRADRKQMLASLIKFYQLHIENFHLRSPEILEEILH